MEEKNGISRRGFLKTAVLAGAALTLPAGLDKVFATKPNQTETLGNDNRPLSPHFQSEAMRANTRIMNVLEAFGRTRGLTSVQVALGLLLQKAPWIVPIPGTTKLLHLEENLRTLEITCTSQEWKELDDVVATPIVGDRYGVEQMKQVKF